MAGAFDNAGHDQYRSALDTSGYGRRRIGSSLHGADTARGRFWCLLSRHSLNHSLVATDLTQEDKYRLRAGRRSMKQRITGFDKDDEDHWRAILECGHRQHVRHDPPLTTREWVLTETGRDSRIGFELDCKRCDEEPDALNE